MAILLNVEFRRLSSSRLFVFVAFCIREAALLTAYSWEVISLWLARGLQSVASYSANLAQRCKYKPCAKSCADICLRRNPIWLQLEMYEVQIYEGFHPLL